MKLRVERAFVSSCEAAHHLLPEPSPRSSSIRITSLKASNDIQEVLGRSNYTWCSAYFARHTYNTGKARRALRADDGRPLDAPRTRHTVKRRSGEFKLRIASAGNLSCGRAWVDARI